MGTMAKWLDHKFEVSPNLIRGFDNLQVKGSCESEEQENGMEKYVVWKNGKPMEISLTAHLSAALGCDVRNEAINFIAEANWGRKDYFYVYDNRGAWKLIMCQVMLMTANISKVSIAPNGKWLWADVALTMKQCGNSYGDTSVPGGAGNETDSGSGSGDYGGSGSGGGKGSVGLRGPGETQLEMDRRIILNRMSLLKERLAEIDKQKTTQRKNRGRLIRVALVGYTNVGKSTIMNMLAKSEVFAENKLFATLDTTVRKVVIENLPFLLADTVGFIRKLPTDLVDSFKSTLDETREADLLLHVVDISHPDFEEQIKVVEKTLADLGCADKPSMIVFNKIDAYTWTEKDEDDLTPVKKHEVSLDDLRRTWMARISEDKSINNLGCIFISAKQKQNIEEFRDTIYKKVRELHVQKYPYNDFLWYNAEE